MKKQFMFASMIAAAISMAPASAAPDFLAGDAAKGKAKSAACAGCHGADGNSAAPTFPKIAGQGARYIAAELAKFKSGERDNVMMKGVAAGLSDEDMLNLGAYFASQGVKIGEASQLGKTEGAALYRGGNLETGVAACMGCHGPSGTGNPAAGYPALSGQFAGYVEAQLKAFAAGTRNNKMMTPIANAMSAKEMKAVAEYVQGLYGSTD